MKKIISVVLVCALSATYLSADAAKGQKAYLKMFKQKFEMNGTKFAAEHTVNEWEDLFENNGQKFIEEYSKRFPAAEILLKNPDNLEKIKDIGDFAKEYGSDSGNVPSCG